MQKQLLSMGLIGSLCCGFLVGASCEDGASNPSQSAINLTAVCKTVFDTITFPLTMIPISFFVAHKLTPYVQADFLTPEASSVVAALGGVGAGVTAYLLVRKLFVEKCKEYGFSDNDITVMCEESNKQEAKLTGEMLATVVVVTLTAVLKSIPNLPTVMIGRTVDQHTEYTCECKCTCECKVTNCLES